MKLWIEKGPVGYYITDNPEPLRGKSFGVALTLRGAIRKARRLLRRGLPPSDLDKYVTVAEISDDHG